MLIRWQALFAATPMDTATFGLWLHQNGPYVCYEIEEAGLVLDAIGNADLLKTDDDFVRSR